MIFIDNKYTKWYNNIIYAAQSRISTGYVEVHHIIPRSFGGDNSPTNLVKLTAREHFVCHLLLPNMVTGNKKRQMTFAIWSMSNRHHTSAENIYRCNSRTYGRIKLACAIATSELHTGKLVTQETREKISKARTGTKSSQATRDKISEAGRGRIHTDETKNKISKGQIGRTGGMQDKHHSPETKKKISDGNKGKIMPPVSDERKKQISLQFSDTIQTDEHISKRVESRKNNGHYKNREATIEKMKLSAQNRSSLKCHCGKECSPTNYKRWHGANCKI